LKPILQRRDCAKQYSLKRILPVEETVQLRIQFEAASFSGHCAKVYSSKRILSAKKTSVVEHDVEQRTVNFQATVVVNKAELSEPIHKEVDAGSSRTDHFR
jgi:hypothetical protein